MVDMSASLGYDVDMTVQDSVVSVIVEVRCSQEGLEDTHPSVKRQLDWYHRRVAEMMPVWAAQYREYLDAAFGSKEP